MRVRVSDPAFAADLLDYLRRADCEAIQTGARVLAVALNEPLPYDAARIALDLELAAWRERNAPATAQVID